MSEDRQCIFSHNTTESTKYPAGDCNFGIEFAACIEVVGTWDIEDDVMRITNLIPPTGDFNQASGGPRPLDVEETLFFGDPFDPTLPSSYASTVFEWDYNEGTNVDDGTGWTICIANAGLCPSSAPSSAPSGSQTPSSAPS